MAIQNCAAEGRRAPSLNWRRRLPVFENEHVTLRELEAGDAAALMGHLCSPAVLEYIAPPPASIERFTRFINWTHKRRRQGKHICLGIVPSGQSMPVGIMQAWPVEADFSTAEWGFALGEAAWGTGLFLQSARLLLDFMFDVVGVERLEARTVEGNARGSAALQNLGAVREGNLRCGFRCGDARMDHVMWSILDHEWAETRRRLAGEWPLQHEGRSEAGAVE